MLLELFSRVPLTRRGEVSKVKDDELRLKGVTNVVWLLSFPSTGSDITVQPLFAPMKFLTNVFLTRFFFSQQGIEFI